MKEGNVVLADSNSSDTTFTMPAREVMVVAVFQDKLKGGSGSGEDNGQNDKTVPVNKSRNTKSKGGNASQNGEYQIEISSPQTGDENHIVFWITLLLMAVVTLTGIVVYRHKKI